MLKIREILNQTPKSEDDIKEEDEALLDMFGSKGWKIYQEFLDHQIALCTTAMTEPELTNEELRMLQGKIAGMVYAYSLDLVVSPPEDEEED